jgi:hypothetical protein
MKFSVLNYSIAVQADEIIGRLAPDAFFEKRTTIWKSAPFLAEKLIF